MKFLVMPQGWGVVIEADDEAGRWLADFLRTKRIRLHEEAIAVDLYEQLTDALKG
jgi:hypothetical protein